MTTITKKIQDFTSGFDFDQFNIEISESSLSSCYTGEINRYGDDINIFFNTTLTTEQISYLDTIVNNHVPDPYIHLKGSDILISDSNAYTNLSQYKNVLNFRYKGKSVIGYPTKIIIIAMIEDGATNGSIRIYDITNNKVITEYSNITSKIPMTMLIPLGNKIDYPLLEADFSIQLKINSTIPSKKIFLKSIEFEF